MTKETENCSHILMSRFYKVTHTKPYNNCTQKYLFLLPLCWTEAPMLMKSVLPLPMPFQVAQC